MTGKTNRVIKRRNHWYIHILLFIVGQIIFLIIDNFIDFTIFKPNQLGQYVQAKFLILFENHLRIYKTKELNWITLYWAMILIIDSFITIYIIRQAKRKVQK